MRFTKFFLIFSVICLVVSQSIASETTTTDKSSKSKEMKEGKMKGKLDGLKYEGTLTEKGKKKADPDVLEFSNGQFVSTACIPYGFSTTSYSSEKKEDGSIAFKSEVLSSKNKKEKMVWEGTIKGKQLTGTAKMVDKDGKVTEYDVKMSKLVDE